MGLLHIIAVALRQFTSWLWNFNPSKRRGGTVDFQAFGREGERRAACFLKKQGYKILCRNFRPPIGGEVDLVCRDGGRNTLVFVEVKARRSERYGPPSAAVSSRKQRRLILAAEYWLNQLERSDVRVQFDVLEVIYNDGTWNIRHLADAFAAGKSIREESSFASPAANRGGAHLKRGCVNGGLFRRRRDRG